VTRYEWPPLPVLDPDQAAKMLAEAMGRAWDDLEAERVRVLESLTMGRKAEVDAWIREFQAAIEAFDFDIAHHLERFATLHLAPHYMSGVVQGGGLPVWTAVHSGAFVSLATDTYDDFLERSRKAGRTANSFARVVRKVAAEELPKMAAGGRTARQTGKRLADQLRDRYGITHVTYRNGAQVGVRTYSEMVSLTKSAVAYNSGTLNEAVANGVEYFEVFDGPDCGWETHTSGDKANGSVRPAEECYLNPISHPRCQRGFGPRPDVKTRDAAKRADPINGRPREDRNLGDTFDPAPEVASGRPAQNARRARQEARAGRTAG
jgi:hypothetical protein